MFPRPQCIVFDAVGTLIQSRQDVAAVYHRLGTEFGFRVEQPIVRQRMLAAMVKQFGGEKSSEQDDRLRWRNVVCDVFSTDNRSGEPLFAALWQYFAEPENWCLCDDVEETWSELLARGCKVAIASNFDRRLNAILAKLPPVNQATKVFISTELGYRKPSRQFFDAIQQRLNLSGHELWMVGDDERADLQGASNAGWCSLRIDRELREDNLPVIHRLTSILPMLA